MFYSDYYSIDSYERYFDKSYGWIDFDFEKEQVTF